MLRALVIFLLIIGFVAEARFHGINSYQRLLSKCVTYLLNECVQQLLRGERRGVGGGRPSTGKSRGPGHGPVSGVKRRKGSFVTST